MLKDETTPFPAEIVEERRLDRRRFLCTAGAAALCASAGHWLGRRVDAAPRAIAPVSADAVADLAAGEARAIPRLDGITLVVRLPDRDVVAFDRRCPHLGCPVVWSRDRGRFECPCHHAAFDARTGDVLFGPPDRGLTAVAIRA